VLNNCGSTIPSPAILRSCILQPNCFPYLRLTVIIWCALLCLLSPAFGQQLSNLRHKKIAVANTQRLDSLSIVPGSFSIKNVPPSHYVLNAIEGNLQWLVRPSEDSVMITYRVFPYRLNSSTYRYRYDSVADFFKVAPSAAYQKEQAAKAANNRFVDFGSMNYSGSFGRSLSFGNSQDAVVNSLFNLQISGMLADSIQIAAAITDNNIPIQPDGTTQQLNEFDRIWLQFKRRPWEVNIGDIDVREQPTYFLSFFKRQQGLSLETKNKIGKNINNRLMTSGAIAKGKFTRNVFQGQEGNQGPYRLTGANNELYFVLLAGTERVFIDGIQMQRGEDQDYIINYNTAELTFTPKQLISKDRRIQVEFEYADRNYLNSLFYLGDQVQIGDKWKVNLGWYANNDAKNSSINQTLDKDQKQFLSEIGDSINNAFYPVAALDTFSVTKILYIKKDTLVDGTQYKIYQYKGTYDTAMYNLGFTELGQGRGNYVPSYDAANGKVFTWVAPVNGIPQGNYEPVSVLVTPKKQRMITAGAEYQLSKHTLIKGEAGFSTYDINTFSSRDKGNDDGQGYKLQVLDDRDVFVGKKKMKLQSAAGYEYVSERFKPLERLRSVEFLRDWGLAYNTAAATEQLPTASIKIVDDKANSFEYAYTGYFRSDDYRGNRHRLLHEARWKGWHLRDAMNYTNIGGSQVAGYFLRPSIELNKIFTSIKNYEVGASYSLEHSQLKAGFSDSLLATSFSFTDWRAYIRSNQQENNRWSFTWFNRTNKTPVKDKFEALDVNNNFTAQVELLQSEKHQFRLNGTYRILKVDPNAISTQQSENSLLARGEYLVNIWKGALTGNALYEIGAGQEQRRDFSYVEVPAGRGEYTWIDYNSDGIPQLNEFELAQFQDQAKYIRIFTPTNVFVKASYNTFNYSIVLSPRQIWRTSTNKLKLFATRFNLQSSLQSSRKQVSDGKFHFNPLQGSAADTNLISMNNSLANTLSFNRFSTNWGADITNLRNTTKAILTYGFETRTVNDYVFKIRKNFGRVITSEISGRKGTNELVTPNPKFDNRNYDVNYYSIEPKITLTKGSVFRTAINYRYDDKKGNSTDGPQSCFINTLGAEAKYNVLQRSVLNGKLSYSDIKFTGPTNTSIAYLMLDALQPGRNILWNLDFTRRLANALEITFQYEGRKAGDTRTVHIGRASLRAIL
jgi:hypothetical protein